MEYIYIPKCKKYYSYLSQNDLLYNIHLNSRLLGTSIKNLLEFKS